MKKIALNVMALSVLLSVNSVCAGGMGTIDPSIEWTGFYAGINLGYTASNAQRLTVIPYNIYTLTTPLAGGIPDILAAASLASATSAFSLKNDGFLGGGQLGYTRNIHSELVAGIETDIQGMASGQAQKSITQISPAFTLPFGIGTFSTLSTQTVSKEIDYLGTLRGRLGYLITPTLLFSGTGGLAYGRVSSKTSIAQSLVPTPLVVFTEFNWASSGSYANTRAGWTAGGNFEWMVHSNWSAKIEYLYYDLGSVTYNAGQLAQVALSGPPGVVGQTAYINAVSTTTRFDGHIARIGVNYRFS